jgi:cytochrome c oxidase subunit 2
VLPEGRAMPWVWIGVGLSTALLLASVIWTVLVLARLAPGAEPRLTIEVTGRQWWWQVRYLAADPAQSFTTANEIHIPVGEPVRLKLVAGDVIHSFWVPQLTGKTDLIPGQTNESWIEARQPGVYRGQCGEYCGVQHAHMGFLVIADTPADFARWRSHQLEAPPADAAGSAGAALFTARCGGCHTVRGTDAAGVLGPDLSHLMTRRTLAAALLPNDGPSLGHWIADPQGLKPGNFMSVPPLTAKDLGDIHAYLNRLR